MSDEAKGEGGPLWEIGIGLAKIAVTHLVVGNGLDLTKRTQELHF